MPTQVDIPNVGLVDFPDEMSPDQISGVIKQKFSQPQPAQPKQPTLGPLSTGLQKPEGFSLSGTLDKLNQPLVTLPRPSEGFSQRNPRIAGAIEGVEKSAEGMATPANIGIAVGTEGLGELAPILKPLLSKALPMLFGAAATKQAATTLGTEAGTPSNQTTPKQRAENIASGVTDAGLAALLAGKSIKGELTPGESLQSSVTRQAEKKGIKTQSPETEAELSRTPNLAKYLPGAPVHAPPQPTVQSVVNKKEENANARTPQETPIPKGPQAGVKADAGKPVETKPVVQPEKPGAGEEIKPASSAQGQAVVQPQAQDAGELLKQAKRGTPEQRDAFKQTRAMAREEGLTHSEFVSAVQSGAMDHPEAAEVIGKLGKVATSGDEVAKPGGKVATSPPVASPEAKGKGEPQAVGYGGDVHGTAQRVLESRAAAGVIDPIKPGVGTTGEKEVQRGREMYATVGPEGAEKALQEFEKTGQLSADTNNLFRAHGEALAKDARQTEQKFGTDSPEYEMAYERDYDWSARIKKAATAAHKIFTGFQGEVDLDTGDYTALRKEYRSTAGEEMPPRVKEGAQRIAKENQKAQESANKAQQTFFDETEKLAKTKVATTEDAKKLMESHKIGDKFTPDQLKALWSQFGKYRPSDPREAIDETATKVATDLGLPRKEVIRGLAQNKTTKRLADDAWRKQQEARQLKEAAKRWLNQAALPGYRKALNNIPRALFAAKVGFHGTVALGTHAPMVAFQPKFWADYVNNYGRMFKMVGSKAFYESQMQDLVRRKNYVTARRAGLVNDPFQYEDFNSPEVNAWANAWSGGGNRGYSVLKLLRQDMFDQQWEQLPETTKTPEVAAAIADSVNHATGVTQKAAPKALATIFFAPRLEASRAAWLYVDPAKAADTFLRWKDASEADKVFAVNQLKEKATVAAVMASMLAVNQGILTASGSKQQINLTDPMKPDFLKFKGFGEQASYGNPFITMARLPLRLASVAASDGGKMRNLVYPDETISKEIGEYTRSQLSPFASLGADFLTREDWQGRQLPISNRPEPKRLRREGIGPYTWSELTAETAAPIPVSEALRDVWKEGFGMSDQQIEALINGAGKALFMGATGARVNQDLQAK